MKVNDTMEIKPSVMISGFFDKHIDATDENILILMQRLKAKMDVDLIPSVFNSQNIDLNTGKVTTQANLSFTSKDQRVKAICMNRIDVSFLCETEEDYKKGICVCEQLLSFLTSEANLKAQRLALNIDFFAGICSKSTQFEKNIIKTIPFYDGKELSEWSSRMNSVSKIKILDEEEDVNVITSFNSMLLQEHKAGIYCHVDINTVGENTEFRFDQDKQHGFVTHATQLFQEIRKNVGEMFS